MAPPATTLELLEVVRTSGVVDAAKLAARVPAGRKLPKKPSDLIRSLVRDGVCTRYQGKMLLAGKVRKLVFGEYRILGPLGRGGVGAVYLGEHLATGRSAAIKILRSDSAKDPLTVVRFQREARAVAALDHPNVVRLIDYGLADGVPFLAMEYVPGITAQRWVDQAGPLPVGLAVHIATQTAAGLQHAHERGFVHRDVKPLNLMITKGGPLKILDMGLAREFGESADRLTEQAGDPTISGTVDFLSPEQIGCGRVDERTDIYALGVTLFLLLTGTPPFRGTAAEKMAQHQAGEPPPAHRRTAGVPEGLSRAVAKMMAKNPADRFPHCRAVIDALAPWCPDTPPPPPPEDQQQTTNIRVGVDRRTTVRPAAPAGRSRRRAAVWYALAAAVVALGAAVGTRVTPGRPPAEVEAAPAGPWAAGELLLDGNPDNVNELAFTPDGARLRGIDWAGHLITWDTATGKRLDCRAVHANAVGNCLSLTPCGRALLGGDGMPTLLWDVDSSDVVRDFGRTTLRTWAAVASPDGRPRAVIATDNSATLHDLNTGERLRVFDGKLDFVWSAALSADGNTAAVVGRETRTDGRGVIVLWDVETGEELRRLRGHLYDVRWLAFRADGRKLASSGFDGEIRLWDVTTGECERTFADVNVFVERVQFLPDGRLLTAAACDYRLTTHTSTVCVWDPGRADPTPVWTKTLPGRANTVAYSPAAGLYAVASKSGRVWLLTAPPEMHPAR